MQQPFFTGVCTALVTPFINGEVNFPMMEQLLRRQIQAGITSVVIAGTTGEDTEDHDHGQHQSGQFFHDKLSF